MRTTTSFDIAKILINEVCSRFEMSAFLLSDNGPQFVSNLFQSFYETLGIKQKFTASYHLQTNMTERVNRMLRLIMAIFAQSRSKSWNKEIQKVAFAFRTSISETAGEIPAFMMFERNPKLPFDLMVGEPVSSPPARTIKSQELMNTKRI